MSHLPVMKLSPGLALTSVVCRTAFIWFSRAAAHGDAKARVELRELSQTMTPQEISEAQQMAQACEASNYRSCEY